VGNENKMAKRVRKRSDRKRRKEEANYMEGKINRLSPPPPQLTLFASFLRHRHAAPGASGWSGCALTYTHWKRRLSTTQRVEAEPVTVRKNS